MADTFNVTKADGSSVLVGGRHDTTPRVLVDGDAGAPALDAQGALKEGGSLTPFFDAAADETAQALKASAGVLKKIWIANLDADTLFLQLFDVAAGSVTVGTTTPDLVIPIPKGDATDYGILSDWINAEFGTAITYAVTTTPTGNGAPANDPPFSATYD